jgi:transposase
MEHLRTTEVEPNSELNKSSAPQRPRAYILTKTQPTVMEKLNSATAYFKRLLMEKAQSITRSDSAPKNKENSIMSKIKNYVGVDIAAETFAASIYQSPESSILTKEDIANSPTGFESLIDWLKEHKLSAKNSIICMEATGVYSEAIVYCLAAKGFSVTVEPPLKVKRAFETSGHKTDAIDSKQIAEYAYRFKDELTFWEPKKEIVEKIQQLLVAREQFVKQRVAISNELYAYKKHVVQVPLIIKTLQDSLDQTDQHIATIEKELDKYIKKDKDIFKRTNTLKSISGFGTLLSANIIAMTDDFNQMADHKTLAAFIGIAPYQHRSGSSICKKDRSRKYGPPRARKLLRLAAQSVATHDTTFRKYYLRKLEEGKAKSLVLNNISNKLLKLAYAMIKNDTHYIKNYKSVHPMYV